MSTYNSYLIAAYTPLHLTEEEMSDPLSVIKDFFNTTDLDGFRNVLIDAFSLAICCSDDDLGENSRRDLLFHQRLLIRLVEAVCLLYPPKLSPGKS